MSQCLQISMMLACLSLGLAASSRAQSVPDPLEAGWRGKRVCERLHEDDRLRVLRCTFPPNTGHERHFHVPYFTYIISGGRMQVTDENGVREADAVAGSSSNNARVPWHEALNVGNTTVVVLVVEPKG